MKVIKKVLSSIMVMVILLNCPMISLAAEADEGVSIRSQANISEYDNGAYIIVERATGEIESYKLEDMLQESVTISNEDLRECEPYSYITDNTVNDTTPVTLLTARSSRTFNWDIKRNTTVYSTTKMNLNVYDKVSVSVTANTSNSYYYEIGLWNNINNTFSRCNLVSGSVPNQETKATWEMAVGGSFSFAIKNGQESVDSTINFSGSYSY